MRLNSALQIYSGGPGSGPTTPCPQCGPGNGGSDTGVKETVTFGGWRREYAGGVSVGKVKPVRRGTPSYYYVRHGEKEKKWKVGFGEDPAPKIRKYLESLGVSVSGDPTDAPAEYKKQQAEKLGVR